MRALWEWIKALWPSSSLWARHKNRGGVQGDDAPGGWQEPVYDDDPGGEK